MSTISTEQCNAFADALFRQRPAWIIGGSLGNDDTRYLVKLVVENREKRIIEIGTASGFSTMVLRWAQKLASDAGIIEPDVQVISYDISETFYGDRSKRVGDAARECLPDELLRNITFRNPATSVDLPRYHATDDITFLFLDADHRHPAPTIDLLLALPHLAPGAVVILHDINLPVLHPSCNDWGVKHLFDCLAIPKQVAHDPEYSNIGSFVVPADKSVLESELRRNLYTREWQAEVDAVASKRLRLAVK